MTCSSSRSVVSVLSLTRNAPNVHVKQALDLEALKLRYIESITAKREVEVDQRLDCRDVNLTVAALEGLSPSLGIAGATLAVSLAAGIGLALGLSFGGKLSKWPALWIFFEASVALLVAVLVLDLAAVSVVAALRWQHEQGRLAAARRDHRCIRVEPCHMQKAEAMSLATTHQGPGGPLPLQGQIQEHSVTKGPPAEGGELPVDVGDIL